MTIVIMFVLHEIYKYTKTGDLQVICFEIFFMFFMVFLNPIVHGIEDSLCGMGGVFFTPPFQMDKNPKNLGFKHTKL